MNGYENPEEEDDYSSASFRARSNTWPLNRPDFALPSSGVCIDETLPEIELEDDDLFTTNENWSTGLVDQDIMSWDPILNAQNQQLQQQLQQQSQQQPQSQQPQQQQPEQQQHPQTAQQHQASQQALTNQPETIHHHHHHHTQHHHQQPQAQHQIHQLNHQPQQPSPPVQPIHGHHQLHSVHIQSHQPLHHHHHHHESQLHHQIPPQQQQQALQDPHQQLPPNDLYIEVASTTKNVVLTSQNVVQLPLHQAQMQQKLSPTQHPVHVHHQTLNSVHCLESDDPNEYHIQQMHHLSLENNPHTHETPQQDHYAPTLNSMCINSPATNVGTETSYNISSNLQNHQHLQPLASARYEVDPRSEYDLKPHLDDTLTQQIEHQSVSQQPHHHNPHLMHQHRHRHHHDDEQHQTTSHQLQTASSSLDNHSAGSHMLSSSLSTSGIGLSADLEDLDYNQPLDPSHIMLPYDDQQNQAEAQPQTSNDVTTNESKQSNSTSTTTKTKLIAPRRNAWGNMSYADLISQAIDSTSDKRLTLSQIYDWMVQHVPYFKDKGDSNSSAGWKNSVRHNLSLHSRFKRIQNEGTGKSSWWTINPEANIGKCARRRAASMEASKYEKKRGRAKKKAEAIRQGLISYPSLSNSSLNGSTTAIVQKNAQAQSVNQFHSTLPEPRQPEQSQPQLQNLDQFTAGRQPIPTLDQYPIDQPPSQQQQQHLQQLQQSDAQARDEPSSSANNERNLFMISSQQPHQQQQTQSRQHLEPRYEDNNASDKIQSQQQHQPQQQQQSQYYYPFELSTAL